MQVGERFGVIERLDHRQDRAQQIDDLIDPVDEGLDLILDLAVGLGRLVLEQPAGRLRRAVLGQEPGEGHKIIGDQLGAALGKDPVALAVDQPGGRRGPDQIGIVVRNPPPGFQMQGPAGAEPAKGVVDARHGGDQAGCGGAVQVRPAKAIGGLERAILVEDDARRDEGAPDDQIGEPAVARFL